MRNTLNNDSLETKSQTVLHPGQYIRDSVLGPKKLTVSAASKLVGVGRPALSNFLNGHAALTSGMAVRIEVAFGIPAQQLIDMQTAYDAAPYIPIIVTPVRNWLSVECSSPFSLNFQLCSR